ncbi:MYND domain-containing protein, partial [Piptocephalis cylindrospora]
PDMEINAFSVAERFCARWHSEEMQRWAGIVMRNGCRKDDSRGGLRQCASVSCGRWEERHREFAKCRRCRKAKYCSKECQSRAWADGHRYWCVERP